MTGKLKHKQITQAQLELWLNDPTTKTYLQCLWWSRDQVKEVIGNGNLIDRGSMEKTFAQIVEAEGQKLGYTNAMNVLRELTKHKVLEAGVKVRMPELEHVIDTIGVNNGTEV